MVFADSRYVSGLAGAHVLVSTGDLFNEWIQ